MSNFQIPLHAQNAKINTRLEIYGIACKEIKLDASNMLPTLFINKEVHLNYFFEAKPAKHMLMTIGRLQVVVQ